MGSEPRLILLDTHAWIWWWSEKSGLSRRARREIDVADAVGISAISCWEVALLAQKRRIDLDYPVGFWVDFALSVERVKLLDLSPQVLVTAGELEWEHGDPADRMIVATAIAHDLAIVTKDRRIHEYPGVRAIW